MGFQLFTKATEKNKFKGISAGGKAVENIESIINAMKNKTTSLKRCPVFYFFKYRFSKKAQKYGNVYISSL